MSRLTDLIAQVKDPQAQSPGNGKVGGALTYTFTDRGEDILALLDSPKRR